MDAENAQAAINETDGCELDGRIIRVNEAQPRGSPRPNYNKNRNDDGEFDGVDIQIDEKFPVEKKRKKVYRCLLKIWGVTF